MDEDICVDNSIFNGVDVENITFDNIKSIIDELIDLGFIATQTQHFMTFPNQTFKHSTAKRTCSSRYCNFQFITYSIFDETLHQ